MKKAVCLVLVFLVFAYNFSATACANELSLSAQAYVLYCIESGEVLCEYNAHTKMKPASTTKIMTTLLALERAKVDDVIVTFSDEMQSEGSSMYLSVGDSLKLSDLAVGMMMASGNDAANAVALSLCDSEQEFAAKMNARAEEIGMKNTHFVTPSGLDDDNHYSCAYDLALLMSEAMENERFREITKNIDMTVSFLTPRKEISYHNHNRLLSLYEPCIGGKTGYTQSAGRCLVSCAKKDGVTLVCVTLDAPSDWDDHIKLFDYGFSELSKVDCDDKDTHFSIDVVGGERDEVILYCKNSDTAVIHKDDKENVKRTVYMPQFLYAPVRLNAQVGMVTYTLNGEIIAQNPLYARDYVKKAEESKIKFFIRKIFG